MIIGIGVEGASDKKFLEVLLNKQFPLVDFPIRSFNGCANLIRESQPLYHEWHELNYHAGFIILDQDRNPCPRSVVTQFAAMIQNEAKKSPNERFLFICVADKGMESWFLSDEEAIKAISHYPGYNAPKDTSTLNIRKTLCTISKYKLLLKKRTFAELVAPVFDPDRAMIHSRSFAYFWTRLQETLK